jgi:hypothetical protein
MKERQKKLTVVKPLVQALLHSVNVESEEDLPMGPNKRKCQMSSNKIDVND